MRLSAMDKILDSFYHSLTILLYYVPSIIGGTVTFMVTFVLSRWLSRVGGSYARRRSGDILIGSFISKIIYTIIFVIGTVITLGLLGLGSVSNKILAGAGITTFVIGFALKDIGENFLAGLILAFSRPYREGSLIECDGIKGIVRNMTMRQTTVEAENGKIILIPNSSIINQPLTKFNTTDLDLRQDLRINVEADKARQSVELIAQCIAAFDSVQRTEQKEIRVIVEDLQGDKARIHASFWFDTSRLQSSRSGTRSEILLHIMDELKNKHIKYSGT